MREGSVTRFFLLWCEKGIACCKETLISLGDAYDVAPSEPKKRGYFAKFRALRAPPLLRRKISETLV